MGLGAAFTLADIDAAHAGASRETVGRYLARLRDLGVVRAVTCIADGHSEYFGAAGAGLASGPVHETYPVARVLDAEAADRAIEAYGRGETDYLAFSRDLAAAGVAVWVMDTAALTITYRGRSGAVARVDRV
jgi:uncharacterized protein YbcV (DUF1398 family)